MVFWIFKKKKDKEAHERIDKVHTLLKDSFSNVKRDVTNISQWYKELNLSHQKHKETIHSFEKRLSKIEWQIDSILNDNSKQKEVKNQFVEAELIDNKMLGDTVKVLTITHQKIFLALYQLQKQLGTNKVSYKSLASVLYNNKSYTEIRSTLSQYLSFLESHGLIEKARKGKESFVGITDIGHDIIEEINKETPIEEKSKRKL